MNETTSAAEDFDGLEIATEEEGGATVLAIDVPDGERDTMLAKIREVAEDGSELPEVARASYNDMDEALAVAELKKSGGVWAELKCFPGAALLLGDVKEYAREQKRLTRAYRMKHPKYLKKGKDGQYPELPDETQTEILIISTFKTSVLDWRGMKRGGVEVPFASEPYTLLMREVDEFGVEVINLMGGVNVKALEEVRGP